MALLTCDFFSEALGFGTAMTVVLPQSTVGQVGVEGGAVDDRPTPLLYLLHGRSDDHSAWSRYTSIERYAAQAGVAVVMPAVARSFYADEARGHRYWTYLSEELPEIVAGFFNVSTRREDTFVAGLSMGGYGALKWALHQPHRFAAAASLSGALDVVSLVARVESDDELRRRVFADGIRAEDDLLELLMRADANALPPLYVACGTEDHLFESNEKFVAAARAKALEPTVVFRAGAHEWGFWDEEIQRVLGWLPIER